MWKYKTKEEKKQTNKQNRFGNKSKAFFAPMGVLIEVEQLGTKIQTARTINMTSSKTE